MGGGILNYENLTVRDCAIVANSGSFGGGIANEGTLTVESSTISGNKAVSGGGGIYANGMTTIRNSTISGNDAGAATGGGINNYGPIDSFTPTTLVAENSTITGNTAGCGHGVALRRSWAAAVTLNNSVVNGRVIKWAVLTGSYNLFSGANPGITGSNNQFSTNPLLGPLAETAAPPRPTRFSAAARRSMPALPPPRIIASRKPREPRPPT